MTIIALGTGSLLRAGLVSHLRAIGFEKIEEADDIQHLKDHIGAKPPLDMVVVILARGVENSISATAGIRAWAPTARIVLVVPTIDIDVMIECFALGASGYLLETISTDGLRQSLKLVTAGEKVFPSEIAPMLAMLTAKSGKAEPRNLASPSGLSRRETEILQCMSNGQSNKVIGRMLQISEATVKVHVKRILRKAHVMNRTQAALWGVATGITSASASDKAAKTDINKIHQTAAITY